MGGDHCTLRGELLYSSSEAESLLRNVQADCWFLKMKTCCDIGLKLYPVNISWLGFFGRCFVFVFSFLEREVQLVLTKAKTTPQTPVTDIGKYKGPVLSPSVAWYGLYPAGRRRSPCSSQLTESSERYWAEEWDIKECVSWEISIACTVGPVFKIFFFFGQKCFQLFTKLM